MRVALGTIEISDETRKAIRKLSGGKGDATRQEVKDYLLDKLENEVVPGIGVEPAESAQAADADDATEEQHGTAPEAVSDEPLPEPSTDGGGGTTAGSTDGGLGSDGIPGGTV